MARKAAMRIQTSPAMAVGIRKNLRQAILPGEIDCLSDRLRNTCIENKPQN